MNDSNRAARKARRRVLAGYPLPARNLTDEEISKYRTGASITCFLCGREMKRLLHHLLRIHNTTDEQYRRRYGLPFTGGLLSVDVKERFRELAATGQVGRHDLDMREVATHRKSKVGRRSPVSDRHIQRISKPRFGEDNPRSKLTAEQVSLVLSSAESTRALATKLGVSFQTIWDVRKGRTWQATIIENAKRPGGSE